MGLDVLSVVSVVCYQVEVSPLRWAYYSSRGVLPSVVCLKCDREASSQEALPHYGLSGHGKNKIMACSAHLMELMKTRPSTDGTNEDKTEY